MLIVMTVMIMAQAARNFEDNENIVESRRSLTRQPSVAVGAMHLFNSPIRWRLRGHVRCTYECQDVLTLWVVG